MSLLTLMANKLNCIEAVFLYFHSSEVVYIGELYNVVFFHLFMSSEADYIVG